MPGGKKVTSNRVAKIASELLRKSKVKKVKEVAGSDLSQAEKQKKKTQQEKKATKKTTNRKK